MMTLVFDVSEWGPPDMASFGGLGGSYKLIPFNEYQDDLFAQALNRVLGERIRSDESFGERVWSSLANVDWKHQNGADAGYSFRAAGDLIASIRGVGNYMDWYCSGPYAVIDKEVSEALGKEGWSVLSVG